MESGLNGPVVLVICGPSGSGKSTFIRKLFDEFPNKFGFSVSHTTRQPRPREQDGVDYFFTTADDMAASIAKGDFLETATFAGNTYGTSLSAVKKVVDAGLICVLDIDIEGVKQLKSRSDLRPIYIFVKPPDMDVLKQRLGRRGTESELDIDLRLSAAVHEIEYSTMDGYFDAVVISDELEQSYQEFKEVILEELTKRGIRIV